MTTASTQPPAVDLRAVQRRVLGVLSLAQIISGVGIAVGVTLSSLVVADLSGSVAISGLAGTAMVLGAALLALPTARAAGRGGRRAGLTLAYGCAFLGSAVSFVAIGLRSWPLLLAGLVLIGGASAGNLAARYSATDLAPPGYAARHLSWVVWATTVGTVAGPNLARPAGALGLRLGLAETAGPFALAGLTFLLATLIINLGLRPDPLVVARGLNKAAGAPDVPAGQRGTDGGRRKGAFREAWSVLRVNSTARTALTVIAVSHTAMVSIMSMTPVHLHHEGSTVSIIGVVISVHIAGMYVFSPVVGWLADRFGRRQVAIAGMLLLLAAGGLTASSGHGNVPQVTAGLFLLGVGWSCGLVAGSAMLSDSVPIDRRPAVQGMSDLTMNVCGATGTVLAGIIVGTTSYGVLGAVTAVLVALVAGQLILGARRVTPAPAER